MRQLLVVDPCWGSQACKVAETADCTRPAVWVGLLEEAQGCGFVGVDMEWAPPSIAAAEVSSHCALSPTAAPAALPRSSGGLQEEARVRYRTRVAVVQLSTQSFTAVVKLCDVVRLLEKRDDCDAGPESRWSLMELRTLLEDLSDLLRDEGVVKVGVGIFGDQRKLHSDYPRLSMGPCVDLVALQQHLLPDVGAFDLTLNEGGGGGGGDAKPRDLRSLKGMAEYFTGIVLSKDPHVVCSDWGTVLGALSKRQISYAAADAEASFDVCAAILARFGAASGHLGVEPLRRCVGQPPVSRSGTRAQQVVKDRAAVGEPRRGVCTVGDVSARLGQGRVKPYYDNINVFNPAGELLFTVDKSKAQWYVFKKRLGKVVEWRPTAGGAAVQPVGEAADDDALLEEATEAAAESGVEAPLPPPVGMEIAAIQLFFSPNFAKFNDAHIRRNLDYFRQPKDNRCVVCGSEDGLVRFAVIPLMYRRYFPSVYMSHNSYDLLLVCTVCFPAAREAYDAERLRIAEEFGFPLAHHRRSPPVGGAAATSGHQQHLCSEYVEIETHREILANVLKYAKALNRHFSAPAAESSCALAPCGADATADPAAALTGLAESVRSTGPRKKRAGGVLLPPERFETLSRYVREHAKVYPFVELSQSSTRSSPLEDLHGLMTSGRPPTGVGEGVTVEQMITAFSEDPSSTLGVRLIDRVSNIHRLLSLYLAGVHPEWLDGLPAMTRSEECNGGDDAVAVDATDALGAGGFVPLDTHGFYVVRTVLHSYDGHPVRTMDHAIGEFIHRWRRLFITTMSPRFLPSGWRPEDGILL